MQTLQQLQSGQLIGSTSIKLSCQLTTFPIELFQLADTLELLDLSGNQLSSLPADFKKFKKLKIAFFSDNVFTELPDVLSECPLLEMIGFKANQIANISEKAISKNVRWLILTNNRISKLPHSIGHCTRLQKVALAGNLISELPASMANCQNLELLRISANQLKEIPTWLWSLPKLAWLAYSDNPCSFKTHHIKSIPTISWHDIHIQEKLGEGASGHIYKAQTTLTNTIAIKIFKGEVTSDGLPQSEMQAAIHAGHHSYLVQVMAELTNHPEQKNGLVFDLIPPSFYNLGLPPSYVTCTRDTFLPETTFHSETILHVAKQIAIVMQYLHECGIMHGDLYAHNIMINNANNVLLGDFGAATLYDIQSQDAQAHQILDVRAFGNLLEDLLLQHETNLKNAELKKSLESISEACRLCSINQPMSFSRAYTQLSELN